MFVSVDVVVCSGNCARDSFAKAFDQSRRLQKQCLEKTMCIGNYNKQPTNALRILQIMVIFYPPNTRTAKQIKNKGRFCARKENCGEQDKTTKGESSNTYAFCVRVRFSTSPLRVDPFLLSVWTDA